MAMHNQNIQPNSPSYFSAQHQAWLKSTGQPSCFDLPRAPAPIPSMALPSGFQIKPPAFVPANAGVSCDFHAGPHESAPPIQVAMLIAAVGGPIAVCVLSNSWLIGLICFALASLLMRRADAFLETEAGRVAESIFNWSLGIGVVSVVIAALSSENFGFSAAAKLCIAATLVVTAIQLAHRRGLPASGPGPGQPALNDGSKAAASNERGRA